MSLIEDLVDRLDADRRYEYEERAGIIEFDGGLPRDEAESLALIDLLRSHPAALVGVTVYRVDGDGFVITTDLDAARGRYGDRLRETVDLAAVVRDDFGGIAVLRKPGHLI